MSDIQVHKNANGLTFEDFKNENGMIFWWASEFMLMLGYPSIKSFQGVIDRATKAFISLGINHYENIIHCTRKVNGVDQQDVKLTRFACYILAMNADPKKEAVALVQAYFAQQTRKFELLQGSEGIERILIRDEIKEGNKSLFSVAKSANVEDYAKFTNAGYLGMYNMMNFNLAAQRGIEKDKLFESMGRTELAANLFRITQTEERIKSKKIKGQKALESTHYEVGREVRNLVIKNTGKKPELLPQEKELPNVRKELKESFKEIKKIDTKTKKKNK